jgi:hypothetical protein
MVLSDVAVTKKTFLRLQRFDKLALDLLVLGTITFNLEPRKSGVEFSIVWMAACFKVEQPYLTNL